MAGEGGVTCRWGLSVLLSWLEDEQEEDEQEEEEAEEEADEEAEEEEEDEVEEGAAAAVAEEGSCCGELGRLASFCSSIGMRPEKELIKLFRVFSSSCTLVSMSAAEEGEPMLEDWLEDDWTRDAGEHAEEEEAAAGEEEVAGEEEAAGEEEEELAGESAWEGDGDGEG